MPFNSGLGVPDCRGDIFSNRDDSRVWYLVRVFLMSHLDEIALEELEEFISQQIEEYGYSFEEIIGILEIAKIRLIQKSVWRSV